MTDRPPFTHPNCRCGLGRMSVSELVRLTGGDGKLIVGDTPAEWMRGETIEVSR